jgi:hypothetical protein
MLSMVVAEEWREEKRRCSTVMPKIVESWLFLPVRVDITSW